MPKSAHYSPRLSREIVRRLYHQAKSEGVPMTVLANQLVEEALNNNKQINKQRVTENQHITEPN
jgi:hypothetical protein